MTSDTVPAKSSGRVLRIALIASLALNVLIIGGVAGTLLLSHAHHGWRGHGHGSRGLLGFARTLPAERGDLIRKKVADERAAIEPLRKAERDARDAARRLLTEEPFDAEKFKAALQRAAGADAKERSARLSLLADTAAMLTPEERRALHAWFEKRRARFRRWRKHHRPPSSP